jgi:hypothetical protein
MDLGRKGFRRSGIRCLSLLSALVCTGGAAGTSVLTYHYDNARTGQNLAETVLTLQNVNAARFGKLFSHSVDGDIYAEPLYVPDLTLPGKGTHDVVFVATQADSVYAFDADDDAGRDAQPLWHARLIDSQHGAPPGATAVDASLDLKCGAILPQVGITATPVIDPTTATMYVEAMSKENGSAVHRLHALDIRTGAERRGAPVLVEAQLPAHGAHTLVFDPLRQLSRPGLLLQDGVLSLAYGSHCDRAPYHGWILAYDAASLLPKGAFVTAPEHGKAGIWMSGAGLAADAPGNLYVAAGDGWFDTRAVPARELGNTVVKLGLRSQALTLLDYFTPFDQARFARHDGDLGSGGILLVPEQPGEHRHLLLAAGKAGTVYLLDRDQLTAGDLHYCKGCASDRQIVQELTGAIAGGVWGMPAYWDHTVYFSGSDDVTRAFSLRNGKLDPTPRSTSADTCEYPGCGLSVSANGARQGIVWALEARSGDSGNRAVLKAYDARNLQRLLYSSDQHGTRDDPGAPVKFVVPTVTNGKVYVAGSRRVTVYGLLGRSH